jgi:hypothetical protein
MKVVAEPLQALEPSGSGDPILRSVQRPFPAATGHYMARDRVSGNIFLAPVL